MFQEVARHCELIFSLLTFLKCDLGEVEKGMFQGIAYPFRLISGLWIRSKCDLGEKTTFLLVARHWKLIFCLLTSPKYVLDEVEKSMYQVFGFLISRKFNFFQADKATIQMVEWQLKVIFCHLTSPKFDLD